MVPAVKTNTTALGDSEHKGEDVSPGSALGLAMARLLQSTPGSLHPGSGLDLVTRRGEEAGFCAAASWVWIPALDVSLVTEQSHGVRLSPSWSLTCQRVPVQGSESFQGSPTYYQRQQRGLFHHPA